MCRFHLIWTVVWISQNALYQDESAVDVSWTTGKTLDQHTTVHAYNAAGLPTFAVLTTSVSTRAPLQSKDKYKLILTVCKLWNPVDGTMTPLVSRTCDIFDVWMVYDSDNIWGNVQQNGLPCDMNWDLNDKRYLSNVAIPFKGEHCVKICRACNAANASFSLNTV